MPKAGMGDGKKRVGKKDEEQVGTKFFEQPPPRERRPNDRPFFATHFFAKRIGGLGPSPNQAGGLGFIPLSPFLCHGIGLGSWFWPPTDSERPQMAGFLTLDLWPF